MWNIMQENLLKLIDNGKYCRASTIINKYGLLHTMNIIYMGLFDYYNYAMTNAKINYARI